MFQQQSLIAQHQRQTQTSTSQGQWNGSQWAPPPPAGTILPPSTPLPPTPPHMPILNKQTASLTDYVTHYSSIYQFHEQQMASCRATGSIHGDVYKWAEYYCDLSTRAAHHYNNLAQQRASLATAAPMVGQHQSLNSNNGRASYASITAGTSADSAASKETNYHSGRTGDSATSAASSGSVSRFSHQNVHPDDGTRVKKASTPTGGVPDSFKDYFHRNMNQCKPNTTQSKSMEELIRLKMEQSLRAKTLSTTDWYKEPLIPIPSTSNNSTDICSISSSSVNSLSSNNTKSKTSKAKRKREHSTTDPFDYQGKSKKGKEISQKLIVNDSYYGKPVTTQDSNNTGMGDFVSLSSVTAATATALKKKSSNIAVLTSKKKKKEKTLEGFQSSKSKLASRADRFSGAGGISSATGSHDEYTKNIDKYMGKSVIGGSRKKLNERDYENMTVKGRCQVLEKEYLRLTAPPKAELVRPEPILRQHLDNLKKEWEIPAVKKKKKVVRKRRDYNWFCSQLKAIRQDLTVQRLINVLAVEVYEFHARIALEEGDLNEYNQSQTQLKGLYESLKPEDEKEGLKNQDEFVAYRIIYYVFLTGNEKYDGGSSDLFKIMLGLTDQQKKSPYISHALKVRRAVAENDYHAFFKLQQVCPNKGSCLMNLMVKTVRAIGLKLMMKAYLLLNIEFTLRELGFFRNGTIDLDNGKLWLKDCGCKFNDSETTVLTKDSVLDESFLSGNQTSSLI